MMKVEEHVLLSTLTTFRTGGPARFLLTVTDAAEVADAVRFAEEQNLPLIPIGGGSNMLAPDLGVNAVFVRYAASRIKLESNDDEYVHLSASAGCDWDDLVKHAVRKKWWGIENLSAIPGTVGAAVVQNISAYGVALEESIRDVEAFDAKEHAIKRFSRKECEFGYRTSIFKTERDRYVIMSITLRLKRRPNPRLDYRDVKNAFAKRITKPTVGAIRRAIARIRKEKFPPLNRYGTAGSFFLNPVMSRKKALAMERRFPGMPLFDMPEGGVKVPLAWILDRVLNLKGMREGRAFLWHEQALVIAAEAGTRSADIVKLFKRVQKTVREQTGIIVFPEVRMLGDENKFSG
jgi:UDP-N-acetylmuramate dehydrogenase